MSKYIVKIKPEYEDSFKGLMILGAKDSNLFVDALAVEDIEELNSDYINEHFADLQDTAYQKGINDGSLDVKQRVEGAYQRGLEDAWNIARKIVVETDDGGVSISALYEMFGTASMCMIMKNNTAQEAIEKLKAYEEKQKADNDIKVGDEVADKNGYKTIVTYICGDLFDGLCSDGSTITNLFLDDNHKTGRHFDVDKILDEMKGNNDK